MRILLHSYNFYPMIGGIETVSEILAHHLIQSGIDCTVVTQASSDNNDDQKFNFKVIRNPGFIQKYKLARSHDVIFSNGTSLCMVLFAFLANRPFCWSLPTYQLLSINGTGWHNGSTAPMSPFKSFLFYFRSGLFLNAIVGYFKLLIRRFVAINFCSVNIAVTKWVANRTKMPNQVVIYNPFPLERFKKATALGIVPEFDFIFLGRLVSEKGVSVLLKALAILVKQDLKYKNLRLAVIGDGPERRSLEQLSLTLGIKDNTAFLGKKTGQDLVEAVAKGKIAVVPSTWEEPMGGVALEFLAAGKNIIVSKNGGLAEIIGDAGLTFENGNVIDLMDKMKILLENTALRIAQTEKAKLQLDKFKESNFVSEYIDLFTQLTLKKSPAAYALKK